MFDKYLFFLFFYCIYFRTDKLKLWLDNCVILLQMTTKNTTMAKIATILLSFQAM